MRQNLARLFFKVLLFGAIVGGVLSCIGNMESAENTKAACDAVIKAACQKSFECAPLFEFESVEACISKNTETQCPAAEIQAAEEDYKSQRKKVDLSALAHCEASYKEASCEDYQHGILCDFSIRSK